MADAFENLPDLLTDDDFCALMRIKPGTPPVWRCTKRYPLRYIKVGRLVRYKREDVIAFLESRTVRPVATSAA